MFIPIDEYIKLSKEERQTHLDLSTECIEIGGNSPRFRGLLAHYLKTTIPSGIKIQLCHACHNGKCSNPKHLYWGTHKENINESGTIWERMINKYGEEEARERCKRSNKKKILGSAMSGNTAAL